MRKDARLNLRVSVKLLREAKALAKRRKVTLSVLVEKLVQDALDSDQLMRTTIDAEQI